jgi:hypothetical protein
LDLAKEVVAHDSQTNLCQHEAMPVRRGNRDRLRAVPQVPGQGAVGTPHGRFDPQRP